MFEPAYKPLKPNAAPPQSAVANANRWCPSDRQALKVKAQYHGPSQCHHVWKPQRQRNDPYHGPSQCHHLWKGPCYLCNRLVVLFPQT